MIPFFLNPWMLAGLAGILLPVLAHLLSRKRYDTVDWGAMQFLELDRRAKRNLQFEDLLLLLVRMAMVGLFVLALARPWLDGSWLGPLASTTSRDVVIVIDSSASMGWQGKTGTPMDVAILRAKQVVSNLRGGDTVMVIEAREQPRLALPGLTRDREKFRQAIDDLATPGGVANLYEAITRGLQILAAGTNIQRDLIVLTDHQALSWKPNDETLWSRLDDLKSQTTVPPRIWVMDTADGELGQGSNFTIDQIHLSRELAVPGGPIRISSKLRYRGGATPISRLVHLEINGQRLADQTLRLNLSPESEATIQFERTFDKPGSQLISLVLDQDSLPADNRSDAAVLVTDSLPVLLVDGDRKLDPTRSETFFAKAALSAGDVESHWILPTVIAPEDLNAEAIRKSAVIVLANIPTLPLEIHPLLEEFVASGRGLLWTLGDRTPKSGFFLDPDSTAAVLFPLKLIEIATDQQADSQGVHVAGNSLDIPWLREFRADKGGTLTEARFTKWWKCAVTKSRQDPSPDPSGPRNSSSRELRRTIGSPLVLARLTTGDPWLVTCRDGRGITAVLTSSLDADWNSFPAKTDYVPWLHEVLFSLASTSTKRNVDVGTPLVLDIPPELPIQDYEFVGPSNKRFPADRIPDKLQPKAVMTETTLAGIYRFSSRSTDGKPSLADQHFVVNFDRNESDLKILTPEQRKTLEGADRLVFAKDTGELQKQMYAGSSRTELWWILVYLFLAMMSVEVWMTRRMLRGSRDAATVE